MAGAAQYIQQSARLLVEQHPIDNEELDLVFFGQQAAGDGEVAGDEAHHSLGGQRLRPACGGALGGDDDHMRTTAAGSGSEINQSFTCGEYTMNGFEK